MSTLSTAEVRIWVANAIRNYMGDSWRESTMPWDLHGTLEGEGLLHQSYSVGIPSSAVEDLDGDRQVLATGVYTVSTVNVRWLYNLGAARQVEDYDAMLGAEARIIRGIMAAHRGPSIHLTFVSANRRLNPDGWVVGDITIYAYHMLALE